MIEKVFFFLASALVIERLMLAIFTNRIQKAVKLIEKTSTTILSVVGLLMMVVGILFLLVIEI